MPSLSPSSSLAAVPRLPLTESTEAGRYLVHPVLDVTFEAPAGWATCCEDPAYVIFRGEPADERRFAAALFFEDFTGVTVHENPCDWDSDLNSQPVGARAIAAALAEQSGRETPVPEEVTVAGIPSLLVRLEVPQNLEGEESEDGSSFSYGDCDQGRYVFWTSTAGPHDARGRIVVEDVYIVDVDDRTLAFDLASHPWNEAADLAAVRAMLESVEIN